MRVAMDQRVDSLVTVFSSGWFCFDIDPIVLSEVHEGSRMRLMKVFVLRNGGGLLDGCLRRDQSER